MQISELEENEEKTLIVDEIGVAEELEKILLLHSEGRLEGEFRNISNIAYHHHTCPGESRSALLVARESIAKYKAMREGLLPYTTSKAKEFGTACHEFVLEPNEFHDHYASPYSVERPIGNATKLEKNGGCKEAYGEWKVDLVNYEQSIYPKTILTHKDLVTMNGIKNSFMSLPILQEYMSASDIEFENTYFYNDPKTGRLLKFRPDIIIKSRKIILDFKTADDASRLGFGKSMAKWFYDFQGAQYLQGAETLFGGKWTLGYIAAEKKYPYVIGLHTLGEAEREIGQDLLDETLDIVVNMPPMDQILNAYSLKFKECGLPTWAYTGGYR